MCWHWFSSMREWWLWVFLLYLDVFSVSRCYTYAHRPSSKSPDLCCNSPCFPEHSMSLKRRSSTFVAADVGTGGAGVCSPRAAQDHAPPGRAANPVTRASRTRNPPRIQPKHSHRGEVQNQCQQSALPQHSTSRLIHLLYASEALTINKTENACKSVCCVLKAVVSSLHSKTPGRLWQLCGRQFKAISGHYFQKAFIEKDEALDTNESRFPSNTENIYFAWVGKVYSSICFV